MLTIDAVVDILNRGDGYKPMYPFLQKWREIYYRTSVHISGVCPSYVNLRYENERNDWTGWDSVIYPAGWRNGLYDVLFDTTLLNKFPRESEIIRNWRKSQYRPIQQAAFARAIDEMQGTIFADSNYSIRVDNEEDQEYISEDNFDGKSLVGYFASRLQLICEDPNSIFVVIPEKAYYETDEEIRPKIYNIPTRNIIEVTQDEIVFYYLDYAWLINNVGYFRFGKNADGKWTNIDLNYGGYYAHMLNNVPKYFAGGIYNTLGFYESYLRAGLPHADEFVGVKSDQQLVDKEASHPFIQATSLDCPDCGKTGKQGYCTRCNQSDSSCDCSQGIAHSIRSCKTCNGSGQVQSWNPAEWKIVPKSEANYDHIKIINPDVAINKNHAERVQQTLKNLNESLHLRYIEQAQSGYAKEKDLESKYLFMQKVATGMYDLIENCLRAILSLRHTTTANGEYSTEIPEYVIVRPQQFAIKTEYDLLDEYSMADKAQLPDFFKKEQLVNLTDKLYGGNKLILKKVSLINQMDSLAVTKESDKILKVNAGAVSKRSYQFSTELPNILDSIIREMGAEMFLEATYDEVKSKVDAIFAAMPPVESATATTTVRETV